MDFYKRREDDFRDQPEEVIGQGAHASGFEREPTDS
jgi:hypothetical protein